MNRDPYNSLLGLLQRGRGEGYRRILAVPREEAHVLLLNCITHDSLVDPECESRGEYYACIAFETVLPLGPLVAYLRSNDDKTEFGEKTPLP